VNTDLGFFSVTVDTANNFLSNAFGAGNRLTITGKKMQRRTPLALDTRLSLIPRLNESSVPLLTQAPPGVRLFE
jgi:hypothetical protein